MKSIPTITTRVASNYVKALRRKGIPVEKYLGRASLPVELLGNAGSIISAYSLRRFMGDAALDSGILDLGFWAGKAPVGTYGSFGSQVASSASLHDAINTFCKEAHTLYSEACFHLVYDPETSWFTRTYAPGTPVQQQQSELYILMTKLQTIQLFLGGDWRPSMIRLRYTNEKDIINNSYFTNLNIEFNAPVTAIAIPTLSLATPLPVAVDVAALSDSLRNSEPGAKTRSTDSLIILRFLLGRYLRHHQCPNLKIAAEMSGTSTRALQRFLAQKGKTYTSLIDEIRFDLAVPLLNDESLTITNIAYELGYTDVAHFSRAFQRTTGMYPTIYRSMLK